MSFCSPWWSSYLQYMPTRYCPKDHLQIKDYEVVFISSSAQPKNEVKEIIPTYLIFTISSNRDGKRRFQRVYTYIIGIFYVWSIAIGFCVYAWPTVCQPLIFHKFECKEKRESEIKQMLNMFCFHPNATHIQRTSYLSQKARKETPHQFKRKEVQWLMASMRIIFHAFSVLVFRKKKASFNQMRITINARKRGEKTWIEQGNNKLEGSSHFKVILWLFIVMSEDL